MPRAAPPVQHKIGYYQVAQNIGFIPILKYFMTVEQVTIKEMSKIELRLEILWIRIEMLNLLSYFSVDKSVALYSFYLV